MLPSPLTWIARPPEFKFSGPPLVRFRYGLMTRRHPYDGVVGRLQNHGFPTEPATLATGLRLLPRWDYLPLNAPALAGRTMSAFSVQKLPWSAIDVQKRGEGSQRQSYPIRHFA